MADFDGDGILDLTGLGRFLKGNGDGTFTDIGPGPDVSSTYIHYYENGSPVPGTLADFNGDNKLDVVGVGTNNNVLLYLGNGDGTFQSPLSIGVGQAPVAMAVGDFNGDGQLDLAVVNSGDNTVTILLQLENVSVALQSSSNPSNFGQAVTFTATVTPQASGTPTGTVTFKDGATVIGNQALNNGTAQYSTSTLTLGSHSITAVYSGDSNYQSSTSPPLNQTVNMASTTVSVGSSANPSSYSQAVTFTATIYPQYGGSATGTVTFYDGTTQIGSGQVTNNAATLTISSLSIGNHSITATYGGDTNFIGSTSSPLMQVVNKAVTTTTLLSSINPSVSAKPVTFTALVSSPAGMPTGKVKFLNGTTVLATLTLTSGSAKYTTSKLPPGSNSITAVYEGDSNNNGSTSAPLIQFVLAATTTTLTSSPNPSAYGEAVLFTAAVASSIGAPPDGETVTFKRGITVLGTGTLSGGVATYSTSTLGVGTKAIIAVYSGDANFATSTSKADDQVIGKATSTTGLTSSQNPSNYGQAVTFTATVTPQFSGTPTGAVSFKDGTKTLKIVSLSGGSASYTTSKLAIGSHNINATYNGSPDFTASSAGLVQTVQ